MGAKRNLWIVPAVGGVPQRLETSSGTEVHPAWSPDGKRLVFVSDRDGANGLWLVPMADGRTAGPARKLIGLAGTAFFPCWSPDGKDIAYLAGDRERQEIFTVASDGVHPPRQWTEGASASFVRWDGTSGGLLVSATWGGNTVELRRISGPLAVPEPLAHPLVFGSADAIGDFDVSRDGSMIAFIQEDRRGDIWTLESRRGSY